MGRSRRPAPKLLAQKLFTIRTYLRITQEQMIERLDYIETPLFPGHISEYERGLREPPLEVLLRYARLVGVPMEVLVDDKLMLPAKMLIDPRLSQELYKLTREQAIEELFKKRPKRLKRKKDQDE
jgi:transcriptional regulator with XRE-family HTH domain